MNKLITVIVLLLLATFILAGTGPSIKKAEDALLERILSQKYPTETVKNLLALPRVRAENCTLDSFVTGRNLVFLDDYSKIAIMNKTLILENGKGK